MLRKRQNILLRTVLFLTGLDWRKSLKLSEGKQISFMLMMKCETR
jgi:hypothetical protein